MTETPDGPYLPRISVIVVGRDGYRTLHPILACLAEQTVARDMEVIAILPAAEEPGPSAEAVGRFGAFTSVVVGLIGNRGAAAAKGVRHATAPVVAFTENHCFPDPDWAEILLAHYDDGIDGVAPAILNANPETALSWGAYASGYGTFAAAGGVRDVGEMPLHNASFRKAALDARGNRLEELMSDERWLQRDIRVVGGRFRFVPAARARHVNEATYRLAVALNAINGRRYGTARARGWGRGRRLAYALGFPLLAVPVLRANLRRLEGANGVRRGPKLHLDLALLSLAHTFGEAVAYLGWGKELFPFQDEEEFMVTERLAPERPRDPRIAGFVAKASPILPRRPRAA